MSLHDSIERSMSGRMLAHAFALLDPLLIKQGDESLIARKNSLMSDYNSLFDDFLLSKGDDTRQEMLDILVREAFLLWDELWLAKQRSESTSYEVRELLKPFDATISDAAGTFRYFWLKTLEEQDYRMLQDIAKQPDTAIQALEAEAAMLLNLMRTFSQDGILCLLTLAGSEYPQEVRERAWVNVVLLLIHYDNRMPFFPEIQEQLQEQLMAEDGEIYARTCLTCIVRTMGVDWATGSFDHFQKLLAPWVAKAMPEISKNSTIIVDDFDDFSAKLGEEFKDVIDEHREELVKMTKEHLDTHFAMFKGLYSTPFFSEPYRWWLPFDEEILDDEEKKASNILRRLSMHDLCDSDRYAFVSAVSRVGMAGGANIPTAYDDPEESGPEENIEQGDTLLCNSYVKMAYRFFRLNPWQIEGPFGEVPSIASTHIFPLLNPTAKEKNITAGHCFRSHAFSTAADIYSLVADTLSNPEVYRNQGLALQKQQLYDAALAAYSKAQSVSKDEWTMRQMVFCFLRLNRYGDALELLDLLTASKPDNMLYAYEKGKCLERMELYAEALKMFFLVELKTPYLPKVQRAIAWCSFLCDDIETAELFYGKLRTAEKMSAIDHLNLGHVYFATGRRAEALMQYQQSLLQHDTLKDFLGHFRPDRHFLMEKGVLKNDIYLMEDRLINIWSQSR